MMQAMLRVGMWGAVWLAVQSFGPAMAGDADKPPPDYLKAFSDYRATLGEPGITMLVVLGVEHGTLYQADYLEALRQLTDEVFFLPGVDRASIHGLRQPPAGDWSRGPLVPRNFDSSPAMLAQLRADVSKAGVVGSLVSEDHAASAIVVRFLEVDPVTGEKLDTAQVRARLAQLRSQFSRDGIRLDVLGLADLPPAPPPPDTSALMSSEEALRHLEAFPSSGWLQDMAICKTSWRDMDDTGAEYAAFRHWLNDSVVLNEGDEIPTPRRPMRVLGYPVVYIQPHNLGMVLGFLVVLDVEHGELRRTLEQVTGIRLETDSNGDAGLELTDRRSLVVARFGEHQSLLGCLFGYVP